MTLIRKQTIMHELRHAYQYDVCAGLIPNMETKETVELWMSCMSAFGGKYISSDENFLNYQHQAIEEDARAFAGQRN